MILQRKQRTKIVCICVQFRTSTYKINDNEEIRKTGNKSCPCKL